MLQTTASLRMRIYTHEACVKHEVPAGHPERPDRLTAVLSHLQANGMSQDYPLHQATTVQAPDILRAHSQAHLAFIESMSSSDSIIPVDPDTWMGPHSQQAAYFAAGAVCNAVDDVLNNVDTRIFCAVRPPGHHAEKSSAMGFCLFNSIAIGALKALGDASINRVAILDFDVHHGNGTVDIFLDNPAVLVCSTFQHPHYPNRMHDVERRHIINTPLAAGSDGRAFRQAVTANWLPALARHKPDVIFVSAGFDAHQADPLANLNLIEADYSWVTRQIVEQANIYSQGRVISTLEGGYDLHALTASVEVHLQELAH